MSRKRNVWLKISGVSGVLTPIVTFTCIALAIASFPEFSWTENALSDLGVQTGVTALLFNLGLIIGGFLAFVFALGLFAFLREKLLSRVGASIFVLDTLFLITIGVFPENVKPIHYYVSVIFFALFPMSIFIISVAFLLMKKVKMGLFTFIVAMVAVAVWVVQFTIKFGSNDAIPETISALSASMWSIILGLQMLKQASHSNE